MPVDYTALVNQWDALGPSTVPADTVAAAKTAFAVPRPVKPDASLYPHWVDPVNMPDTFNGKQLPPKEDRIAHVKMHTDYQQALHAWRAAWMVPFHHSSVLAKIAKLNEPPMVDTQRRNREKFVQVGTDGAGRPVYESPMETVQAPGKPWWHENGHKSTVSPTDLEAVLVKHGIWLL